MCYRRDIEEAHLKASDGNGDAIADLTKSMTKTWHERLEDIEVRATRCTCARFLGQIVCIAHACTVDIIADTIVCGLCLQKTQNGDFEKFLHGTAHDATQDADRSRAPAADDAAASADEDDDTKANHNETVCLLSHVTFARSAPKLPIVYLTGSYLVFNALTFSLLPW